MLLTNVCWQIPTRDPLQWVLSGGSSAAGPWTELQAQTTDFPAIAARKTFSGANLCSSSQRIHFLSVVLPEWIPLQATGQARATAAVSGSYCTSLNGLGGGTITQTVANLLPGAIYTLRWFERRPSSTNSFKGLKVSVGSTVVSAAHVVPDSWNEKSVDFDATANTMDIKFEHPVSPTYLLGEWTLGSTGDNCDVACTALGKTCSQEDLHSSNSLLSTDAAFELIMTSLGSPCAAGWAANANSHGTGSAIRPHVNPSTSQCYASDPNRDVSTFDCAANFAARQRLCWCTSPNMLADGSVFVDHISIKMVRDSQCTAGQHVSALYSGTSNYGTNAYSEAVIVSIDYSAKSTVVAWDDKSGTTTVSLMNAKDDSGTPCGDILCCVLTAPCHAVCRLRHVMLRADCVIAACLQVVQRIQSESLLLPDICAQHAHQASLCQASQSTHHQAMVCASHLTPLSLPLTARKSLASAAKQMAHASAGPQIITQIAFLALPQTLPPLWRGRLHRHWLSAHHVGLSCASICAQAQAAIMTIIMFGLALHVTGTLWHLPQPVSPSCPL